MVKFPSHEDLSNRMSGSFRFFNHLDQSEVQAFLQFCQSKQVNAGETIWNEGDEDNYAAFVMSGKVGIKKRTEFKDKHLIVGLFTKGSVVGELCLLTQHPRSVTAVALEPAEMVILSSQHFENMLSDHPMLGLKLLKHIFLVISKRLNRSTDRIAQIF
jgi:CRP/FNR family cyclic AMP-dependent transcriptional regulator